MDSGISALEMAYENLFTVSLIVLGIMIFLCLVRAILGPRVADRVVAVNMMGTLVIVAISVLALRLEEGYLVDVSIIYAMASFLAVIVLTKVFMGIYQENKEKSMGGKGDGNA